MPRHITRTKTTFPKFYLRHGPNAINVGDLFVQEAHEGHDKPQEEALEDEGGSKREHDTAW